MWNLSVLARVSISYIYVLQLFYTFLHSSYNYHTDSIQLSFIITYNSIVITLYPVVDLRNAVIRWRRRNGNLPPGHSVSRGVLTLPAFRSEYAGEYICSTTIVPQRQTYEASVFIIVQGMGIEISEIFC